MLFRIDRASDFAGAAPPCVGAVKTGRRDELDNEIWEIDIPDLAALIALNKEVGRELGIADCHITIIDDYRE